MNEQLTEPDSAEDAIPPAAQAYMESINRGDLLALAACFSETAVIIDENCEITGTLAIQAWAKRKVMGCLPLPNGIRLLIRGEATGAKGFYIWYTFRFRTNKIIFADCDR